MKRAKEDDSASVRITKATHKMAKKFVGKKIKLGMFIDDAILEKIQRGKEK